MEKDPVCGMMIDEASGISSEYNGKKYYFCCMVCKQKFEDAPECYLK
ncbi:MAG: YHS domain-containing protein [Candidatus Thorarchaeota archaeon]